MFKVVWVCRFNKAMTREEARRHWLETHGPIALKVPGMRAYVQNHAVASVDARNLSDDDLPFDGYAEAWWDDRESYLAAMDSPEWKALNADGAIVFELETMTGAVLEEHVLRPKPAS